MKNVCLILFLSVLTTGLFAQSATTAPKVVFDGTEFTSMSPEDNARAYADFLTTTYSLTASQKQKVHDIRLKSAKHYNILAEAGAGAELEKKKARVISYDYGQVLNVMDKNQRISYSVVVKNRAMRAMRIPAAKTPSMN